MVQDIHNDSMEMLSTLQTYEEKATKDPLTGLYNHGEIETQLNSAIAHRQKNNDPVSIMMIDLDHFKDVNDNYGHAVGDTTLQHFSKIILDIVPEEKFLAGRWGGEEFVIVCRDRDESKAAELAELIRSKVDQYLFPEIAHITCSIGVTELKAEDDFKSAFDRIDKALYASKEGGRNKVTIL